MDEVNLSTLRAPQFRTTTVGRGPRAQRDLSGIRNLALDNSKTDALIAQSPGILSRNASLARKQSFLGDLQQQLRVQEALAAAVPQQVSQQRTGRRVSKTGLRAIAAEQLGPLEREQLALSSIIENVKGNISAAKRLASATGSATFDEDRARVERFQAEAAANQPAIEASGQSFEEIDAEITGQQARVDAQSIAEADRVQALGELAALTADADLIQSLMDAPLDEILATAEGLALSDEDEAISEAQRIADQLSSSNLS